MLEEHGYTRKGRKWLSPWSESGTPGVSILCNEKSVLYSHHGKADPLSAENHGGHSLDVADTLCCLRYDGDFSRMIKTEADLLDPQGQRDRRREYMTAQANQNALKHDSAGDAYMRKLFSGSGDSFISIPDGMSNTVIGKLADRVAHCLEIPRGTVLLSLLGTASACVSTQYATAYHSGTRVATGLYVVTEQPPSTQKNRVLAIGLDPYRTAIHAHNIELAKADSQKSEELPRAFGYLSDATTAALDRELSSKDTGRFYIASAEQNAFQSLFPGDGSGFNSNNGLLLNGWAGEWAASARVTRSAFEGYTWGAIVLFAQSGSIQRVLDASSGQGLTERFLFACEPSNLGKRTFDHGSIAQVDVAAFSFAGGACVSSYSKRVLSPDSFGYADLWGLELITPCPEGYAAIRHRKISMEQLLGKMFESGENSYLGWLGKLETHVLKIAAVIHVFESLGISDKVPGTIPLDTVHLAMRLVTNIGAHMRHILQTNGEAGESAEAQTIMDIVTSGRGGFKRSEVLNAARRRSPFRSRKGEAWAAAATCLDELVKNGVLVCGASGCVSAR